MFSYFSLNNCRESAGTGPVVLKVVPATGAAFSGITMDKLMCLSFSTPTIGIDYSGHVRLELELQLVLYQYEYII